MEELENDISNERLVPPPANKTVSATDTSSADEEALSAKKTNNFFYSVKF